MMTDKHHRYILPKLSVGCAKKKQVTRIGQQKQKSQRLYNCCECDSTFVNFSTFRKHESQHTVDHKHKVNICELCLCLYPSAEELQQHASSVHDNKRYLCVMCGKSYASRIYLWRHVQETHKKVHLAFYCKICEDSPTYCSREGLIEHFEAQHAAPATTSTVPNIVMGPLNLNDDHEFDMTVEFLDEFLFNNDCSFGLGELDLERDWIHNEPIEMDATATSTTDQVINYICPLSECSRHLSEIDDLFAHLIEEHKQNNNIDLECPYCEFKPKFMSYLREHLRVRHAINKKHMCQICDKRFATTDHLRKHVLSAHLHERRQVCSFCQKSFLQVSHLRQHEQVHTTGKPYRCSHCELRFWRKIDMLLHYKKKHQDIIQ